MSENTIIGSDNMVAEYLLYRGFTQTFQSFESEKSKDKTKRFDVSRIVETIFSDLNNFEIENHVLFWDFLSKRFFFHLDSEHLALCSVLKVDLLKYYLINAYKTKNKDKITDFFSMYSHEILAESADYIPGNLRGWFVLPYMEEPEKDMEFLVYFTPKWAEMLRVTLHNFLSIVLSTAPPPKLLNLERWFRSDGQIETRAQLRKSSRQIECLMARLEKYDDRIRALRNIVKELVAHVFKGNMIAPGGPTIGSSAMRGTVALFDEDDEEAELKRQKAKELSQSVMKLAVDCAKKTNALEVLSKEDRLKVIVGKEAASLLFEDGSPSSSQCTTPLHNSSKMSISPTAKSSNSSHQQDGVNVVEGDTMDPTDIDEVESKLIQQLQKWLNYLAI
mmetsp:Transcript_8567/g.11931  ORF Transcript_8567/g.11931 Transcript_8567/m.11931 type:complete len:390 (-) Transcript_8567:2703-3872(-)